MRFSPPERTIRHREQQAQRLSMRCEIWRNTQVNEPAPGYQPDWVPQRVLSNVPCYVHNLLYLMQGEFVFPEREYATGQLRAQLPFKHSDPVLGNDLILGNTIKEQDDIRNISLHGEMLWADPLNIFLVVPHSIYTLLILRGN